MPVTTRSADHSPELQAIGFDQLSGWQQENHQQALTAFQRSCVEIMAGGRGFNRPSKFGGTREDWLPICQLALAKTDPKASEAKTFFETNFTALRINDPDRPEGLFTGYYEPEAEGSRTQSKDYQVPIYRKPNDLIAFDATQEAQTGLKYGRIVDGKPRAYFTREEIENGALRGRGLEIAWLKSWEDAFFIHIQGSGRVRLPDGGSIRLAYALKTGLPYTGIGGVLVERGVLTRETNSMQSIRKWMARNETESRKLMWLNKSFVFFREIAVADENLGALGAQQVNLTPQRSLAVDRSLWAFGTPVWLDTTTPPEGPAGSKPFQHVMIAQDTGSAIKGLARGDVYWGWGPAAELTAGHMKSTGTMTVLLPSKLAEQLLAR